ncbi:MmgE/PrpD family protein [Pseudooceanicola sp. 216_PA32_1]|uniref:MmgE/PrpD family protein n=1 Tax=Pseudooceanicola pacificus TaxID=2676438 RepID=A0A844WDX4_9RHOB|nr:MmgE/PrpD family protein [Pseudooceanicola pacificus]MWB78000.1 MmgE/PrpD family protein [Pseudooceanicola pacificus]
MTRAIDRLADLAANWIDAPVTAEVRDAVHCATLDWFATTLPGTMQRPATLLAASGLGRSGGKAWCYTGERRIDPRSAAFINGSASHTVEFDDIFRDGGYHPGSPTLAAALAVAQDLEASRDAFDRAVIGGYEVGCRVAMALQPSHYVNWHITGTVGTFGSAAAAAMLLGCDRAGIANAIAIATSFAGGVQQNLQGESMVKAMHPGHAADAGILAAYAAAAGATGARDSLDGPRGYAAATSDGTGNWGAAFDGAGEWTPITRMTVKIHGCCGHIFPSLDALDILRRTHGFGPGDIEAIRIEGYGPTKDICDRPDPQVAQEARFSAQYCLSAQMVLGGVRLAAFEPEALRNPDIRALMARITVDRAEDLAAEYPRKRMARLHVTLKDGRSWTHFQPSRRGDPDNPISRTDLEAKYEELVAPILTASELERLRKTIFDGTDLPDAVTRRVKA